MGRWKEFYRELISKNLNAVNITNKEVTSLRFNLNLPDVSEIKTVINKLKNDKARGIDKV